MRAEGLDLLTFDPLLERAAERCVARWEASGPLEVRHTRVSSSEPGPASVGNQERARVVVGGPQHEPARELALALNLIDPEDERPGFQVGGRRFSDAWDCVLATFEDPSRPDLPVTLLFGEGAEALRAQLEHTWPASRPALFVFQYGRLSTEVRLELDGRTVDRSLRRHEPSWVEDSKSYRVVQHKGSGLTARVGKDVLPGRVNRYLDQAADVRARVAEWTGATLRHPSLIFDARLDRFAQLGARGSAHRLARCQPRLGLVQVLLAPGMVDDAAAAVAEAAYHDAWGEPVPIWMRAAAAVDAVDSWWGRSLQEVVDTIALCESSPSFEAVFGAQAERRTSVHVRLPLRALVFRSLRARLGGEGLARAWRGEEELGSDLLEDLLRASLERSGPEGLEALRTRRAEQRARALDPERSLHGFLLAPPADGRVAGYGSTAAHSALKRLQKHGAGAVALSSLYAATPGPWSGSAWNPTALHGCLEGDVALAATLSEARSKGLTTMLVPELLTSPAGGLYGDAHLTSAADWETFFEVYEVFLAHYALLADLLDVDVLCVGSGMPAATRSALPRSGGKLESQASYEVRRVGWARLIARARELFGGALTFGAQGEAQAEGIEFWEDLDWVGVTLSPSVGGRDERIRNVNRLRGHFEKLLTASFQRIAERHQRPFLITSIGFRSVEGGALGRAARGAADPDLQARLYSALAGALNESQSSGHAPRGVFLRAWPLAAGGLDDRGYGPRGKPAEDFVSSIVRR